MTSELKPSDVLSKAADLIEPEGAWTQGAFARPDPGTDWTGSAWPDVRVCWCVRGAIAEAERRRPSDDALTEAEAFLERHLEPTTPVGFNDSYGRTQAEVVTALRKAAELARSEGQ